LKRMGNGVSLHRVGSAILSEQYDKIQCYLLVFGGYGARSGAREDGKI
jgi:hypothetical protein